MFMLRQTKQYEPVVVLVFQQVDHKHLQDRAGLDISV